MSFPLPTLCGADPYLTRDHLQELYDDYMSASHPTAAAFSSLVNNIRLPYLTTIMGAKEALLDEQTENARRLDELQAVHRRERAAALVPCTPNKGGPAAVAHSSGVGSPVGDEGKDDKDGGGEDLESKDPRPEQEVPELINKPSILYVSHNRFHGRDWVSWAKLSAESSWKENLHLNVFRTQQPGTVKIRVLAHELRDRIYPIMGNDDPGAPWKDELEFWAYPNRAPGTEKFLVAYRDESSGYIFASGVSDGKMSSCRVIFQLWLPM